MLRGDSGIDQIFSINTVRTRLGDRCQRCVSEFSRSQQHSGPLRGLRSSAIIPDKLLQAHFFTFDVGERKDFLGVNGRIRDGVVRSGADNYGGGGAGIGILIFQSTRP